MNILKQTKKIASVAAATIGLSLGASSANAVFINGLISFVDGFATLPTLVSTDTFFDIAAPTTVAIAAGGDFAGLAPALADNAGDIDTLAPGGQLYDIGGFSFDWGTIMMDTNTALSCNAVSMLCTDTRNITIAGEVSAAGFDSTAFIATWSAQGACAEDQMNPGACTGDYTSSWSSSVVALGVAPPPGVPSPAPLALISIGLIGLAYQRRRKA